MPEEGSRGGSATCEPPFVKELRRLGRNVDEQIYTYADTQVRLPARVIRVLRTIRRFRKQLRSGSFDLVHLNTSFDTKALLRDSLTLSLLRRNGTKIFLKFHGSDAGLLQTKNPFLIAMRRHLFSRADGIGILSSEERANFVSADVSQHKLFLVSNVVNGNALADNRNLSPNILETDVPQLLFIARFIPEKGLADVIRACELLRERDLKFVLLCLGDGPARRGAEREVARLHLQNYVRFIGHINEEEAAAFYATGTVLVFPTYHSEGFSMTIFNAAAAGLPIITTRIRAAADYLSEPDNCLWAMPHRPNMLAEKISDLLQNSELRLRMSHNNRQLAARFSAERVVLDYLKMYEDIVGQNGRFSSH